MPVYDFRCNACGRRSALTFKTIAAYDAARGEGALTCPHCGAVDLTRLISRVAIARPTKNYTSMGSDEMLHVLEGGKSMVPPLPGSAGYQRLFGEAHPPYRPVSDALKRAIENLNTPAEQP